MASVDIGIRHQADLVITKLVDVEIFLSDARAKGRDECLDLAVTEHLIEPGFLHIQDLALERKHRLILAVTSLLCRTAGRITLYQIKFGQRRILFLTVSKLARECRSTQCTLANDLAGLSGCFTCTSSVNRF